MRPVFWQAWIGGGFELRVGWIETYLLAAAHITLSSSIQSFSPSSLLLSFLLLNCTKLLALEASLSPISALCIMMMWECRDKNCRSRYTKPTVDVENVGCSWVKTQIPMPTL